MLTTDGLASCAIVRNVVASSGPTMGALFVGGMVNDPAKDTGDRPRRDARTIPTTREDTAIIKP
jgi:hypothetical protein